MYDRKDVGVYAREEKIRNLHLNGESLYRTDGEGLDQQEMDKLVHAGDYESVVNQYIDHFVVPEDRERMRKATLQRRWE